MMNFLPASVKNLALGTLKKTMTENGYTFGTFFLNDAGDIDAEFYKVPVITPDELTELRRVYNHFLNGDLIERGVNNG